MATELHNKFAIFEIFRSRQNPNFNANLICILNTSHKFNFDLYEF